ncbi:MAG: excinuclease ABC subunit UvrA, partial [Bacteroidetes bacterium]
MNQENNTLEVVGARVHNLKNISIKIPRDKLVVITGLSGSGKSSLAFDTIYAEGQRRYVESFASYARQFLGTLERPDVDKIDGLSPVISIEQKTVSKNPRSTVGTITEIYDFIRLLYSKVADAYSYVTGEKMVKYSEKEILNLVLKDYDQKAITILAPIVKGRKGHYRELFKNILKQGFLRVRVDGKIIEIDRSLQLDRYKVHDIEIVIDRLEVKLENKNRINDALTLAMKQAKGVLMILEKGKEAEEPRFFSKNLMCPSSGISYDPPAPNSFSFNSPYG